MNTQDERARMFLARFYPDREPPQTRFAARNAETVHNTPHTFKTPQEALSSAFAGERVTIAGKVMEVDEMERESEKDGITPHKGGRTAHAPRARLTEEERKRLDAILNRRGESMADWIMRHVKVDEQKQKP